MPLEFKIAILAAVAAVIAHVCHLITQEMNLRVIPAQQSFMVSEIVAWIFVIAALVSVGAFVIGVVNL